MEDGISEKLGKDIGGLGATASLSPIPNAFTPK